MRQLLAFLLGQEWETVVISGFAEYQNRISSQVSKLLKSTGNWRLNCPMFHLIRFTFAQWTSRFLFSSVLKTWKCFYDFIMSVFMSLCWKSWRNHVCLSLRFSWRSSRMEVSAWTSVLCSSCQKTGRNCTASSHSTSTINVGLYWGSMPVPFGLIAFKFCSDEPLIFSFSLVITLA